VEALLGSRKERTRRWTSTANIIDNMNTHDSRTTDPDTTHLDTIHLDTKDPGRRGMNEPIRFDTKIAVLLREDLEVWQRLNVTAFLVSGIASANPELIGDPYEDADGTQYLPMFRQPVLVFQGGKETLTRAHAQTLQRGLRCTVFTQDLFSTGNDRDNRAVVKAVGRDALDLVGLAVHGPKNAVDKILKGASLHG
jgi:hypothetical protein